MDAGLPVHIFLICKLRLLILSAEAPLEEQIEVLNLVRDVLKALLRSSNH